MGLAIDKAKKNGVGWVAAKGSNHFGICQWYTEMAMKQGDNILCILVLNKVLLA